MNNIDKFMSSDGNITVYNCDCFDLLKYLKNNNIKINSIITDPPYGLIKHKIESSIDWELFCKESYDLLEDNSYLLYFQSWKSASKHGWFDKTTKVGFEPKYEMIWDKLQVSDFLNSSPTRHESIYFYLKGDKPMTKILYDKYELELTNGEQKGIFFDRIKRDLGFLKQMFNSKEKLLEYINLHFDNKVEYNINNTKVNDDYHPSTTVKRMQSYLTNARKVLKGSVLTSVIDMKSHNNQTNNKPENNVKHPTVKPVQLLELLIKKVTNENELILDPFLGSGTTAIACKNTNRKFIGCEIDKEYFEIIKNRLK